MTLLETNVNGPEDTRIAVEEFDLNMDRRFWFEENCKNERREYEVKIRGDVDKFKTETENILKEHWESMYVKPKSIYVRRIQSLLIC